MSKHSSDHPFKETTTEPPKSGFVPRTQNLGISHLDAIRCTLASPIVSAQRSHHGLTDNYSASLKSCVNELEAAGATLNAITMQCSSYEVLSQEQSIHDPNIAAGYAQYCPHVERCAADGLPNGDNPAISSDRVRHTAHCHPLAYMPSQQTCADNRFGQVHKPTHLTRINNNVSDVQFDVLRSEPQLIIS